MTGFEEHIDRLKKCIDLEEKEQLDRYQLRGSSALKELKKSGLVLHPIQINRKYFGYADYPEIEFRLLHPVENSQFRDGASIEFFHDNELVKARLLQLDGRKGIVRLYASDFPDWIDEKGLGLKAAVDDRTIQEMRKIVSKISENQKLKELFSIIHGLKPGTNHISPVSPTLDFLNKNLNDSQKNAIQSILNNEDFIIVHGPPGTGKTTTIIETIYQLVKEGKKVLVSAPSNAAVDLIALQIKNLQIPFLRIGNQTKVHDDIFENTPEGMIKNSKLQTDIKKLRIRSEDLRKMANQYKRRFGKDERDQRKLLIEEVKLIRKQIKDIQHFFEEDIFEKASVVLGTPIGLTEDKLDNHNFDVVILDEAGQCLEPLAYILFQHANKIVLAGDHLQLPPTVLSADAKKLGFDKSILDLCYFRFPSVYLLDTQYRMKESIARFSNLHFYENKLKAADHLVSELNHVHFFDTAGAGFEEETGEDGNSLMNKGEIDSIMKLIEKYELDPQKTIFISPYNGQVSLAEEILPKGLKKNTIDSFQGQEAQNVIISLVRSNKEGNIGFLNDYRRMNVAMTRAKENLYIIGDSVTLSKDKFYNSMISFFDANQAYHSIWELMY